MTRLAYASPLPPQRSGIADYSARLLPRLAERLAVELFVPRGTRPGGELAERFAVHPLAEIAARAPLVPAPGENAVALYQMGNHPAFHGEIYRALRAHPGIVVLHEVVLHHMVRELTLAAGDPAGYVEAMRYAYGPTGEAMARRAVATGVPLDAWRYPLFERAVDAARAVIVHSRFARDRVLAARPAARVEVVPLFVDPEEMPSLPVAEARALLGLPAEAFVVGAYGFLSGPKRIEASLHAFARLRRALERRDRPEAIFLLAGEAEPKLELPRLLAGEQGAGVRHLGRLPLDRFLAAMRAADVALNLRHPTGGETSATLVRLLACGTATLVTDGGSMAELPDGTCGKVPADAGEEEVVLAAYLEKLAADPGLRRALGEAGRSWVLEHHQVEDAARRYAELALEVAQRDLRPAPVVPPLAPYPPENLEAELYRAVGAGLADLGIDETETDTMAGVVRVIGELSG